MKVFVSSVMRGFEPERGAVRRALELLRHEPVMAEGFGAKPHSSETACLEQVRASDVYVGVLGPRYGFKTPQGVSVTEAEYQEARQRGLPILFFVTRDELDADQAAFFARAGDYQNGYFVCYFSTPQDLQDAVVQALNDLTATASPHVSSDAAKATLRKRLNADAIQRGETSLSVAILPKRAGEEWVPVRLLGDTSFRDELKKVLLFGDQPRLFDDRYGCEVKDGIDHVVLSQTGEGRQGRLSAVSLFQDGTVLSSVTLAEPRGDFSNYSLARSSIIDRYAVEKRVLAAFRFADAAYQRLPRGGLLSEFFVTVRLTEFQHKLFGEPERHQGNSISIPTLAIGEPLWVPTEPLTAPRSALVDGEALAADLVERLARVFLANHGYFPAPSGLGH